MTELQLFCVPFAGGSSASYYRWRRFLPEAITVVPVELAGRGRRIQETPLEDAYTAAEDVAAQILAQRVPGTPYALWGHSMGALLAYEAYFALSSRTADLPEHMVFTGRGAPQGARRKTSFHTIADDDDFIAAIETYGGSTEEALADPELRRLFLPILRADFKLSETYAWRPRGTRIQCDITVANGRDDMSVAASPMREWAQTTTRGTQLVETPGGHFFLFEHNHVVSDVVASVLSAVRRGPDWDDDLETPQPATLQLVGGACC